MPDLPDSSKALKRPCDKCPFSRAIAPGGTGGADPLVYVGQAFGPFWLPCHKASGFDERGRCNIGAEIPQCAGAAIYRANAGTAARLPAQLHALPADPVAVFASPAELVAHHMEISRDEAEAILQRRTPLELLKAELRKQEVKVLLTGV
jgi:hypothetical protein